MLTINDFESMSDEELYKLSLQKNRYGNYTSDANGAYAERKRRSGFVQYSGVPTKCSKYTADLDYYGSTERW